MTMHESWRHPQICLLFFPVALPQAIVLAIRPIEVPQHVQIIVRLIR